MKVAVLLLLACACSALVLSASAETEAVAPGAGLVASGRKLLTKYYHGHGHHYNKKYYVVKEKDDSEDECDKCEEEKKKKVEVEVVKSEAKADAKAEVKTEVKVEDKKEEKPQAEVKAVAGASASASASATAEAKAEASSYASVGDALKAPENTDTLSTLLAAVAAAGITIPADATYTIFAPTNKAFADAAIKEKTGLTAAQLLEPKNKDALVKVLSYHVVPAAAVKSTQLKDGQKFDTMLKGGVLTVGLSGGKVKINDATVVLADVKAGKSIVHVIDKVLIPKELVKSEAKAEAKADAKAEVKTTAVKVEEKKQEEKPKVEVVKSEAKADAKAEAKADAKAEEKPVVKVEEKPKEVQKKEEEKPKAEVKAVASATAEAKAEASSYASIADAVKANSDTLSTLLAAVTAAGITIPDDATYTIFAPTNKAFADAAIKAKTGLTAAQLLEPKNKDALVKVLSYHVVPSAAVKSTQLKDGQKIDTLNGVLTVKLDGGKVKINDATVVLADVKAGKSIVHVIDQVLLPKELVKSEAKAEAKAVAKGEANADAKAVATAEDKAEAKAEAKAVSG